MDLRDYPRPKGDTGIGVHWNAGFPEAIGLGKIRDYWLPELIALGVKWVKLARHDGGLALAELLLKHDIMPVVRLYRPQPNPDTLDETMLNNVSDYVSAGVRYFEFNNEPDLGVEWQGGLVPPDALQIVARNAIIDMEAILARGGYPGIPALATGTKWDIVGEIHKLGRRDLLAEPVWQALHNYSLNHPLDYPYDPGNQQGAPYQQAFYDRLAAEAWDRDAWGGWSLERVNAERRDHSNPGVTAFDDPSCWRAYERYDQLIRNEIGRSLPILATENGYIVGERHDPRYPATTPQLHMAQTLEACRIMMGTSSRFDHAPDYYFCTAFWLLGNYTLGHWAQRWENAAWYSSRWPNGKLPIVDALRAEPKQERVWRGDGGLAGHVSGIILNGAGLTLVLERADDWSIQITADADGQYEFVDVPMGSYTVTIQEVEQSRSASVTRERPAATANFDLSGIEIHFTRSVVRGVVRGGSGLMIRLRCLDTDDRREQLIAEDGSYRFTDLAAGSYVLGLAETEIVSTGIELDGRNEVVIDLEAPGWGWEVSDGGPGPGFGVIRCRVKGEEKYDVRLWTKGWAGITQRTGSKLEYGDDACEFAPLGAGIYHLQPEGLAVVAEVDLDGSRVEWVTFAESDITPPQESVISGRVRGGAGHTLVLTGPGEPQTTTVASNASYRFGDLPAGIYRLAVEGTEIGQARIVLDGHNHVTVDLDVPEEPPDEPVIPTTGSGVIFGTVTNGAGRTLRLVEPSATAPLAITQADENGLYRFEDLAAGRYAVQVMAIDAPDQVAEQRSDIEVDGESEVQIDFSLSESTSEWHWQVEDGGPGPGFSLVRCQVVGRPDVLVQLATPGWSGITRRTGSKPEYGPDVCEFAPLGAGTYSIAIEDQDVQAEVLLEANRIAWVRFTLSGEAPPPEPEPDTEPAHSSITGRVRGGAGRIVVLEGPIAEDGTDASPTARTATVSEDETYRFTDLGPGSYRVSIPDTDPPTGSTLAQTGITLDGTNTIQLDLDLAAVGSDKLIEHYLLVGSMLRSREDFLAMLRYVARFQPEVGTDETVAATARHVTILGGTSAIGVTVERDLRTSGCLVQRIEADYTQRLTRLLEAGQPYEDHITEP